MGVEVYQGCTLYNELPIQVNFKVGVLGVVNVRVYVNEIVYVNWRMRICISIIRCAWFGLVCP